MKIHLVLVFLFIGALTLKSQITADQRDAVDQIFQANNHTDGPGCAVAIIRGGEIIFKKGYGMADLEHRIAIHPATVFYAGSISKQFVTSAAILLAERGKLDLDAKIQEYLPDANTHDQDITVQHLIYHTSGIKDYFGVLEKEGLQYLNQISPQKVYELVNRQESLDFLPGEKYQYSNSGYLLLGLIIEKVSGVSLAKFIEKEIFVPLGMRNSIFLDDCREIVPNRAWGYNKNISGQYENMIMRFDLVGSGGMYTTVSDLALWDANFYNSRIGSDQFLNTLLTTGKLNNGSDTKYAFALRKDSFRGLPVIGHSGSLGGYRAQFMQFPEQKFSIIILSNYAKCKPGELAHSVANVFLTDYFTR